MKSWPPTPPDIEKFVDAFQHMKKNVRGELHQRDMSRMDASLAQYMRTSNIGTRLMTETEGLYKDQLVVAFETITDRKIRKKLLRVFSASPHEDGVFVAPTDVSHLAINGVSRFEARVLADELVGGFYEQYEFAKMMGVSEEEMNEISPESREEALKKIYEEIRGRALTVIQAS